MGNLICQHEWGRDMDRETDFIRTTGFPHLDGEKADFLLDTGIISSDARPDELAIPVLAYRWDGKTLYVS